MVQTKAGTVQEHLEELPEKRRAEVSAVQDVMLEILPDGYIREAFRKASKKLDMGKCCLQFKKPEDLPLDAIGEIVAGTPPEALIEQYEASRRK